VLERSLTWNGARAYSARRVSAPPSAIRSGKSDRPSRVPRLRAGLLLPYDPGRVIGHRVCRGSEQASMPRDGPNDSQNVRRVSAVRGSCGDRGIGHASPPGSCRLVAALGRRPCRMQAVCAAWAATLLVCARRCQSLADVPGFRSCVHADSRLWAVVGAAHDPRTFGYIV